MTEATDSVFIVANNLIVAAPILSRKSCTMDCGSIQFVRKSALGTAATNSL
jgi:hypothetical protein